MTITAFAKPITTCLLSCAAFTIAEASNANEQNYWLAKPPLPHFAMSDYEKNLQSQSDQYQSFNVMLQDNVPAQNKKIMTLQLNPPIKPNSDITALEKNPPTKPYQLITTLQLHPLKKPNPAITTLQLHPSTQPNPAIMAQQRK
ncbi:MAG: hypothetical protein ACX932_00605 [Gammaproteobacteria bacterium]